MRYTVPRIEQEAEAPATADESVGVAHGGNLQPAAACSQQPKACNPLLAAGASAADRDSVRHGGWLDLVFNKKRPL